MAPYLLRLSIFTVAKPGCKPSRTNYSKMSKNTSLEEYRANIRGYMDKEGGAEEKQNKSK